MAVDVGEQCLHALLNGVLGRIDNQIGTGRRLVWRGNAREVGDLASTRLAVEALWIALLADSKIGLQVDRMERLTRRFRRLLAVAFIGRNEGSHDDVAGIGE